MAAIVEVYHRAGINRLGLANAPGVLILAGSIMILHTLPIKNAIFSSGFQLTNGDVFYIINRHLDMCL